MKLYLFTKKPRKCLQHNNGYSVIVTKKKLLTVFLRQKRDNRDRVYGMDTTINSKVYYEILKICGEQCKTSAAVVS